MAHESNSTEQPVANGGHPDTGSREKTVILPPSGWPLPNVREIWRYRELLGFLAMRDIRLRYKQTALGVAWALLQPLFKMLVFTVVFGGFAKISTDGVPSYAVFAFCGLLPWQLFLHALTHSSNSIIENERLVTKVYFPRLIIPFASVLAGLLDFAISFLILLVLMAWYGIKPTPAVALMPVLVLIALVSAMGVGLWLAALNTMYRDFRYTLSFVAEAWFFLTPVVYPSSMFPEKWRWVLGLNPMAGVVEGFRWAMLGTEPPTKLMAVSAITVVILLCGGVAYFRKMESTFADTV